MIFLLLMPLAGAYFHIQRRFSLQDTLIAYADIRLRQLFACAEARIYAALRQRFGAITLLMPPAQRSAMARSLFADTPPRRRHADYHAATLRFFMLPHAHIRH